MATCKVNTHEAKTRLSELIRMVEDGDEVIVARHGVPVVRIVRWTAPLSSWFGGWEGRAVEHGDIVGPDAEIASLMGDTTHP